MARALSTLRGFHRFLVEEGRGAVDPTADIPGIGVADLLPKALSEEETGRLLGAVVGTGPAVLRDRALLELLYGTGARVSEVVGLNLGDVAEAIDGDDAPADPGPRQGEQGAGGPPGAPGPGGPAAVAVGRGATPPRAEEVEAAAATPRRSSSTSGAAGSPGWGRSAWSRSTPTGSAWPTG